MSRRTKADRRFKALYRAASDAYQCGEKRLAADKFLEAFEAAPSKWTINRTSCLQNWQMCFFGVSVGGEANFDFKDDATTMQGISKDSSEPAHVRFIAFISSAFIQHVFTNYTKEATSLRRALVLASQIGEQERLKIVDLHAIDYLPRRERIGDFVDACAGVAKLCLDKIETPRTFPIGSASILVSEIDRDRFKQMFCHELSTAGRNCDCCGKTAEEVGIDVLHKCSRCRISFYCSKTCQAMQWHGHKLTCKKYGEVVSDEHMLIHSLHNRRDLNGKRIVVRRSVPGKEGRWEVELLSEKTLGLTGIFLSVASKNLRHLRSRDSLQYSAT